MTKPDDYPMTTAVRMLREKNIPFEPHLYTFVEHGGTKHSADALGVPEHSVVKTLVMEDDAKKFLIVLMHGDREVSTKQLARVLNVKRIEPADAANAQRVTGYQFGGTSPFGTRTPLSVYVERSIFALPKIYINGGKKGFLVSVNPNDLRKAFPLTEVDVAVTQ